MVGGRITILLVALLGGCATPPTPLGYRSAYYGLQADTFFVEWGAPVAKHELADGSWVYLWFARRDSAYTPGHTDSELIGNTAWWKGYTLRQVHDELRVRGAHLHSSRRNDQRNLPQGLQHGLV